MWESAQEFNALLVFGEHRYYGESMPFSPNTPGCMNFLTTEQAMADFALLIDFIKSEYWSRGYTEVMTPNIFSTDLWKISGHYEHYRNDMFLFQTSDKDESVAARAPQERRRFWSELRGQRRESLWTVLRSFGGAVAGTASSR